MNILILSAHTLLREGISLILRPLGPEAVFVDAGNWAHASRPAESHPDIALILAHVRLSTSEGRMALRELGRRCPAVPVLVISDTVSGEDPVCAFDLGAWGYIGKTACGEDLLRATRIVLSGRRYVPYVWRKAERAAGPEMALMSPTGRERPLSTAKPPWTARLTTRQLEVLNLLTEGMPNKVIARRLGVAYGTVKCHVSAILRAMNATNRTQAVCQHGVDRNDHGARKGGQ